MTVDSIQATDPIKARLITMKEAAEILGISQRGLYRFIASGELPRPVKIGKASRMVLTEIEDYIERIMAIRPEFTMRSRR